MTSVCVGGVASQRKTGIPSRIYADPAFVVSALPAQLGWMAPFVPYLPPIYFDVDAFCAAEPIAAPTLVEATIAAVLAGNEAGAAYVAAQLIWQVIQAQLWYQWCECSSGTQPTAPAGQSAPTDLPAVNPPAQLPPAATAPCVHEASSNVTWGPGSGTIFGGITDLKHLNPTSFQVTTVNSVFSGTGPAESISFQQFAQDGTTVLRTDVIAVTHSQTVVRTIPAVAGVFFMKYTTTWNATTGLTLSQTTVDTYCNGAAPGGTVSPCCPPDPNLNGLLQQILLYVTTLQRQLVPFAYIAGAQHTGLSGAGNFDIQGLLGVLINVTTTPTPIGREGTSPTEYFDMGWLTFGTDDGYPSSFRLERSDQVLTPVRCSLYTNLAYDLHPGVVITVTELKREP
jgi:hypothetical protein